ncbi:tudor domain-containing protein 5 isoform X2 [Melanotaenia boesemani]|uniref:tudor domain-containing protein 5 isoform X2 n=1 Tax=Melanotaenia boesemani TaxID=1250792 RepID=UPI001C05CC69|nr:tudor domain-containing protein 5 isoform X2 [Melanotaenia boesemani]
MSQEELLANLKKDVRSLLVSSKMGLDPDQLRKDYFNMLGHPMPLKCLGFRNIMDMVREMPDVVSINYRADGSPYLKVVSDDSTRHIEELVAKQRMSKTDKVKREGFSCYYPRYNHVALPRKGSAPLALPPHLRAQLRLLLSQGGLRLSDLEACYLRCFGHPLRVHDYGFYSIREMLEAAGDMVLIQQGRFGSVLTLRHHMLPRALQRMPHSPYRTGPIKPGLRLPHMSASTVPDMEVRVLEEHPAEVAVSPSPLNQQSENILSPDHKESADSSKPEMVEKSSDTKPEPCQDSQCFQKRVIQLEEELRQQILENGLAGTVSQELKEKLSKVVSQTAGGLSVHDLPAEYKRLFGEDLPLIQTGFVSVTELVGALSDIFHLIAAEDHNGQHWIIKSIHDTDNTKSDSDEIKTPTDTSKLPVMSTQSSGECTPEDSDEFTENDENKELETSNVSKMSEKYPLLWVLCSELPLDALQNQHLKPPTRHNAREVVAVLVEQVVSPGHFYIRFTECEEAHAMENMMIEMRRCYTFPEVSERYRLPQQFIRQGQVCCVSPRGMWFYRVVIHAVISSTQVQVYYVDFGDIAVVKSADLKFLKSSYSVLPAQAVPSSLTGIKPTSGSWTSEATAAFKNLCSDRTLVGALDCYTGDVLQLFLCDTHTDQDIYIHAVLVSQGHGTTCSPAVSAESCVQVTPVSLYLGKGLTDLPEVDKKLISFPKSAESPEQSTVATLKIEEEEIPALELIEEDEITPCIRGMKADSFSVQLNDQNLSWSEPESLSSRSPPTRPPCPASTPNAPPDLIHTSTAPADSNADPKTQMATPTSATSSTTCHLDCPPKEVQQQPKVTAPSSVEPPLIQRTPAPHTPHQGQIQNFTQGSPVSPFTLRNPGILFPLFGSRQAVTPTSTSTQIINQLQKLLTTTMKE